MPKRLMEFAALTDLLFIETDKQIREEQGLIYSSNISFNFDPSPVPSSSIFFSTTCDPENVEQVIASYQSIFNDLKTKTVTQEKIEQVKAILKRRLKNDLQQNEYWSHQIWLLASHNFDLNQIERYEEWINEISQDSILSIANQYLNDENFVIGLFNPKSS